MFSLLETRCIRISLYCVSFSCLISFLSCPKKTVPWADNLMFQSALISFTGILDRTVALSLTLQCFSLFTIKSAVILLWICVINDVGVSIYVVIISRQSFHIGHHAWRGYSVNQMAVFGSWVPRCLVLGGKSEHSVR